MHREQVEAVVEETLARYLGSPETLAAMREILQKSNMQMLEDGQSPEVTQQANLLQSMLISYNNLARALGKSVEALQSLQGRIELLEKNSATMQEAILNLQIRLRQAEGEQTP